MLFNAHELIVSGYNVSDEIDEFEDVLLAVTDGKAQANTWSFTVRNVSSKDEFEIIEPLKVKVYEEGRYVTTEINIHDYAATGNSIRAILASFGHPDMSEFKVVSQDIPAGTACTVTISPLEKKDDGTYRTIEDAKPAVFMFDPVDLEDDEYAHIDVGTHVYDVNNRIWVLAK